jgi:ribosome biogenesis protein MAK21
MQKEDSALLEDVRAFAAQLSFETGLGTSDDGAFQDFAPHKAKQPVNKSAGDANGNINKRKSRDSERNTKNKSAKATSNGSSAAVLPERPLAENAKLKPGTAAHSSHEVTDEKPKRARRDDMPAKSLLSRQPPGPWYEALVLPPSSAVSGQLANIPSRTTATIEKFREKVEMLLNTETTAFEARASSSQSLGWLQQANKGGTTADRVAAMALLVQESPIANLKSLDGLIAMMKKRGGARGVVVSALDALKELWIDVLLPPDRKLRYLDVQPLQEASPPVRVLLYWGFEDSLKRRFATFLEALEALTLDNLEHLKDRGVKAAYDILTSRPEGEATLLAMLVNKLGDPSRKLASKVGYLLNRLLSNHPAMKLVVVREVERFVFRPGLGPRARYYAVVFLNQIVLTNKEASRLPGRLIDLYFTLFKLIIQGQIGTVAAQRDSLQAKAQLQAQAHAARRGKKKVSVKGSQQVTGREAEEGQEHGKKDTSSLRLGGEVDSRMLAALITGVRRAFPFVPAQDVEPLIEAHADALFKLVHAGSFGVATQALLLLHQLMSSRNAVSDRFYRALYSMVLSPELPTSTKAPMFLSLLFKALGADVSPKRVAAFLKRLVQVACTSSAQFACGCLMLVSKTLQMRRGLWNLILEAEDHYDGSGRAAEQQEEHVAQWPAPGQYDAQKRDPQFANADQSCLWELLILTAHVHPSVVAMARTLLAGVHVKYDGDPLKQLTLGAFLDKFLQKKPKHISSDEEMARKGDSLMQPLRAAGELLLKEAEEQEVAPDEAFFHKFYVLSGESKEGKKKKKKPSTETMEDDLAIDDLSESDNDSDGELYDSDGIDDFLAGEEDGDEDVHYATEDFEEDVGTGRLDKVNTSGTPSSDDRSDSEDDEEESSDGSLYGNRDGKVSKGKEEKAQVFAAASEYDELIRKDLDEELGPGRARGGRKSRAAGLSKSGKKKGI